MKNSENSFFYISRILGLIGEYENEKFVKVFETIDGIQDPDVNQGQPQLFTAAHVGLTVNYIICQAKIYKGNNVNIIFDMYDRKSLNYCYSFKLNVSLIEFIVYDNLLIGCDQDNNLYFLKFKESKL